MNNSYIAHHGVKGMKWGVRKNDINSISKKSKQINSGSRMTLSGAKGLHNIRAEKKQNAIKTDHLTNKQMEEYIYRKNLESRYKSIRYEDKTRKGYEVADNVLQLMGGVTTVAASSLLIYTTLRK